MKPKAISVLSGGLDSTVATAKYADDYDITAITFNYGQQSLKAELKAARKICEDLNMKHVVIDLPWLNKISNSSLTTNNKIPTPDTKDLDNIEVVSETAKSVWVPARNTIFCSIALAYAESLSAEIIIVGWDYEEAITFPDNSKEYLESFNRTIKNGSFDDIKIVAPLIDMNKKQIIQTGINLNAPLKDSYSCYSGSDIQCGVCESCLRRKRAFKKLGIKDPASYQKE